MSIQLPDNPHSREPSLTRSLQSTSAKQSAATSRPTIKPVVTAPRKYSNRFSFSVRFYV